MVSTVREHYKSRNGKRVLVKAHSRVKKRKYKARTKNKPSNRQFLERVFQMQLKAKRIDRELLIETVKQLAEA